MYLAPHPQTVTYSYRAAPALLNFVLIDPIACTMLQCAMAIGLRHARGRNGIEFAFMPFFSIRRFARAFGSPFVTQRFGCDHLVTSPRTVAPSPNISSLFARVAGGN